MLLVSVWGGQGKGRRRLSITRWQGGRFVPSVPKLLHYKTLCLDNCPKHLLGQNFPSKGKLGGFSLRGKNFPLRDNFPLGIAFRFP